LLTFGSLVGARFWDFRFLLIVNMRGKDRQEIYIGGPAVVVGRVDPVIVPLVPGASYTAQIPISRFVALEESKRVETFTLRRCQLRVELDVQNTSCRM
jgi:hypothetical protein